MDEKDFFFIKTNAYSIQERVTKKGVVYDAVFRVYDKDGNERQKKLSGYSSKGLLKKAYVDFTTMHCTMMTAPMREKNKILFDDAFSTYFRYCESTHREASLYDLEHISDKYIVPYFKGRNLSKLKKKDLYEWQDAIWQLKNKNGEAFSFAYLKKIRALLNAFLNWCKQRYDIANPLDFVRIPKRVEAAPKMQFWEKADFDRFIAGVDDIMWRAFFSTLYYTGCRVGEAFALSDKDFRGKVLQINKTVTTKVRGVESFKINGRKNKKELEVPVPKALSSILNEYLEWKKRNDVPSVFLFGGDKPLASTSVRRKFDYYISLADVTRIRIHDLRHSYVSLLIHLGANYTVIADLIGDTKEQVVKTYGHMYANDKRTVVDSIDNL